MHGEDGETRIKEGDLTFEENGSWNFKVIFLSDSIQTCNLELNTFSFFSNRTLSGTVAGNYASCSRFVKTICLF